MNVTAWLDRVDSTPQTGQSNNVMKADIYYNHVLPIFQCLQIAILFLGLSSNTFNIVVFIQTGRQDPVSASFLMLSLCDFFYIFFISVIAIVSFLGSLHLGQNRYIPKYTLGNFLTWFSVWPYDTSIVISAYIGLIRASCVAFPLKFKSMFTLYRTRIFLFIIIFIMFLLHCPMMVTQRLTWSCNSNTNICVLVLQQNRGFPLIFHNIVNKSVLSNVCLIIAIISLIVLAIKLREAMKFRLITSSGGTAGGEGSAEKEGTKINSKDLQVIKSVALVTLIFVACNLPTVLISYIQMAVPLFSLQGDAYLYVTVIQFTITLTYINSSINIFVYYNYNTNYRQFVRSKLGTSSS